LYFPIKNKALPRLEKKEDSDGLILIAFFKIFMGMLKNIEKIWWKTEHF